MILRLDPKPGRNYSAEETQHVIPDVTIYDKDEEFEISVNDEDIPTLNINKAYKDMLKKGGVDPETKEFLDEKLKQALALLRAVSRRKFTLRKIVETIVEIQQEAVRHDLSHLKPLTFQEVAQKLNLHESTVCRTIMNKYVKLPYGVVALKDFFASHIQDKSGQPHSSSYVKRLINDLIEKEDKKHPLSDQSIAKILSTDYNLNVARRTIAKYREELRILTTTFRKER
jgi:RNA polymerase sigma-54 factor